MGGRKTIRLGWATAKKHESFGLDRNFGQKNYGHYFLKKAITQHNFLTMLQDFFWKKHLDTAEYKKYYFQQDGAPPHKAKAVQEWLTSKFSTKFVDKFRWPPRSPDLNPCDFYLWGNLKAKVYNPLPKTLDELKANIEREIKKSQKTN